MRIQVDFLCTANVAHQLLQKVAWLLRKQKWRATFCSPRVFALLDEAAIAEKATPS